VHGTAPYPPPRTHPLLWVRILVRRLLEARILGGQRRAPRARGTCDGDGGADGQVDDHSHAEGCGGDGARPPGPSPEMGRGNVWYVGMGGGGWCSPPTPHPRTNPTGWSGTSPSHPHLILIFPRVSPESQRTLQNFSLFSPIFYVCFSPRFDFRGFYLHFQQTKHEEQQELLNSFPE